jgi:uncharacterized cupredoxin-like copper-binding protein
MMTYEVEIIIIGQASKFNKTQRGQIMFKSKRIFGGIAIMVFLAAFILAACGGSSSSTNSSEVQISLAEFSISSSLTTFKVGVPYHFVVTNKGSMEHEIYIMPPTTSNMSTDQIAAATRAALAGIAADKLPAGATQSFDYTFTQAYPSGSMEFACHLTGHYEAGMLQPIVVQ